MLSHKFKHLIFYVLFFLIIGVPIQAQQTKLKGQIKGKVIDSDTKRPIMRATITIHNPNDSSQITGAYTDKSGNFNINVNNGNYYVKVNFLGYEPQFINNVVVSAEKTIYDCRTISLKISSVMTDEIEVTANREAIEVGLDRKVFNIEDDVTSLGGSAIDVLANIPSVTVDQDDNVSLRGSSDVQIMIDGRISDMSAADALAQIPATMITSVELITNPGARYEADGTAGMINIVTTKQRENGLNAMVNLNVGTDDVLNPGINGSISANYNHNKWNFFLNVSSRYNDRSNNNRIERTLWDDELIPTYLNYLEEGDGGRRFFSGKIGADYNFTKNDVLTYSFRYNAMRRVYYSNTDYHQYDNDSTLLNYYIRDEANDPPFGGRTEHTLSYKHNFEQKGHELYMDLFYNTMVRDETEKYKQYDYLMPEKRDYILSQQENHNNQDSKNFAAQLDYALPIGTNFKLEAGGKFSTRSNNIDNHLYDWLDDEWIVNTNVSDKFQYNEDVVAAYITASSKLFGIKYNIGVRSETTIIDFDSDKNPSDSFTDDYTMFFPSIYLSYDLNENHSISANLASRMRRPRYWSLNPAIDYDNPTDLQRGNPDLRPESHYLGEFGYMLNYEKTTLTATLFYRYSVDGIEMYKEIWNGDTTISMPMNISSSLRTGLDIILMQTITDWWKMDANFSLYNAELDAANIGAGNKNAFNWNARINSVMNLWQKTSFTLTGAYRSKMLRAQGEMDASWNLDAAFRYNISKQIALSCRVRDIFNTRQWNRSEEIPNVLYSKMTSDNNSRSYYIGVTYRFNEYKQKQEREFDEQSGRDSEDEGM